MLCILASDLQEISRKASFTISHSVLRAKVVLDLGLLDMLIGTVRR